MDCVFARAGRALRLRSVPGRIWGARGGVELCITEEAAGDWVTRFVATSPHFDRQLVLFGHRSARAESRAAPHTHGIRTGDRHFDERVHVAGNQAIAIALLNEDTRRSVERLVGEGAEVRDGELRLELAGRLAADRLIALAEECFVAAKGMSRVEGDVAETLVANAHREPNPLVRRRNLQILAFTVDCG